LDEKTDPTTVRDRLAALPGVTRVLLDPDLSVACLLLRQNVDAEAILTEAEAAVGPGFSIEIAFPPESRSRERVRFVELERQATEHHVTVHVTLEWGGTLHRASVKGERSTPIELRTAAAATLQALQVFLPENVHLRLGGVKQVRAFDVDLAIVSVHRTGGEPRNLVGAVVTHGDPLRTVAVSVLNALNRLLGNYLTHPHH
jgi:hypothetical protein